VTPYPTSATPYPTSVAPYPGYAVTGAVKPRVSAWTWTLAALCPLLLIAAAGAGVQYQNLRAANEQAIATRAAQIEELNTALRRLTDERADLDSEQGEVLSALANTTQQIEDHNGCPDAVLAFSDAAASGTDAEADAAFDAMVAACDVTL
jgi:hypothetical protein